jgi:hypothetical protein
LPFENVSRRHPAPGSLFFRRNDATILIRKKTMLCGLASSRLRVFALKLRVLGIPKTMRAVVYRGVNDLRLETVPVPRLGANELLVKVAVCGVLWCPF